MSEVSRLAIPKLEEDKVVGRVSHVARYVGGKALDLLDYPPVLYSRLWARDKSLDLLGRETIIGAKERIVTAGALGAVAAASTVAEYKYGHEFRNSPFPLGFLVYSGRHFLVGNLPAARINVRSKLNNFWGIMAASMAGDIAAEAGQSAVFTGMLHNGWSNVGDFVMPNQVVWGNAKDAAAALMAGGAVYARQRIIQRKRLQEEIAQPELHPTALHPHLASYEPDL